jgi:ribose transport system ATP-binding protein
VTGRIRVPEQSEDWSEIGSGSFEIPVVPHDRQRDGIIAEFNLRENLSLSILDRLGGFGRLRSRAERTVVERWTKELSVVAYGVDAPIVTLSGGNQQKVVMARCLANEPEILVLCEPTAGVDIGARLAIYELIAGLSENGLTVVVASSDLAELVAVCTRVVVLRNGRITAEFSAQGLTEHQLVSAMEGQAA